MSDHEKIAKMTRHLAEAGRRGDDLWYFLISSYHTNDHQSWVNGGRMAALNTYYKRAFEELKRGK